MTSDVLLGRPAQQLGGSSRPTTEHKVDGPARSHPACGSDLNSVSFNRSSRSRPSKLSMKPFRCGLPSAMSCHPTRSRSPSRGWRSRSARCRWGGHWSRGDALAGERCRSAPAPYAHRRTTSVRADGGRVPIARSHPPSRRTVRSFSRYWRWILVIDRKTFAPQRHVQTAAAEPPMPLRQGFLPACAAPHHPVGWPVGALWSGRS